MTFEKYQYVVNEDINIISIYEEIIKGIRRKFPMYTWLPANGGFDNFRRCIKHLVIEKLMMSRDDYCESISKEFTIKHKLDGGFKTLFQASPFKLTEYAFPDWKIEPWELKRVFQGFWDLETSIRSVKWLIEKKLSWNYEEVIKNLSYNVFKEYGLGAMLGMTFDHKVYTALITTYPKENWEPLKLRTATEAQINDLSVRNSRKNNNQSKIKECDVEIILNSYAKGTSQKNIASLYNVDPSTISKLITNNREDKPNE